MPRKASRPGETTFVGVHSRLIFPNPEDEKAVLDLMRRFSSAVRFAYNRLLEGSSLRDLYLVSGPVCTLFGLNAAYAVNVTAKAESILENCLSIGDDPKKVIFGGRNLFEQIKKRHLSGKRMENLKRKWRESRQGNLYSRGAKSNGGNPNTRLIIKDGALWLRINLGNGSYAHALVKTRHKNLEQLVSRVYAKDYYNVALSLKDGKVYAHFSWSEELPPPVHTKEGGVLGIDINSDPYHLALAVVSPDGNLKHYLTISLEEVDQAKNRGKKELLLWEVAHEVVHIAEEHGVAIATERLKYLRKSYRGDGSGRAFRRKQHRFAYRSILQKIHSLARKRSVEVVEVNPQDTSTIGMLKYAPQLSLSKDVAAAYVIGRRALGFVEKVPKGYENLINREDFVDHVLGFYQSYINKIQERKKAEKNPYINNRLSRESRKAERYLSLFSSLKGSPESQKGSTDGRNPSGANLWRVLRVGLFLPLLGREVPRDLSPLKPILFRGSWEGWKGGLGPPPGGGPGCASVCYTLTRQGPA